MNGSIRSRGARDEQGRCSWELRFDLGPDPLTGKRRRQHVSFRGTKREAQARLRDLLGAADKGAFVEPSKVTVAEHVRKALTQWRRGRSISLRTAERYEELIERQIVPHLGAIALQKLKRDHVESWYATLLEKGRHGGERGISPRTIAHAHRVLRKALGEAVADDLVHKNAAALAKNRPKVEDDEQATLAPDQVTAVIEKMREREYYPLFITALFTGMRAGELLALRWGAVDLEGKEELDEQTRKPTGRLIRTLEVREATEQTKRDAPAGEKRREIRFKKPKSRAGTRKITLPEIVVQVLRSHRREILERRVALGLGKLPSDALLFPSLDGAPRTVSALSRAWTRAAEAASIEGVTFHGLRHTHVAMLIDRDVDIVTISKRLGHARPDITLKVYAHMFKQRDGKAAAAINDALASIGKAG